MKPFFTSLLVALLLFSTSDANSQCQASFTYNFTGTTSIAFQDQSSNPATITAWLWSFGDGTTSNLQNPIHAYNATGYYTVCLTVTTINPQCTSTYCDSIFVTGGPNCLAEFQYSGSVLNNTVNFFDFSVAFNDSIIAWSWDFGDGNTSSVQNPTHTYANPGTYIVILTITTASGCMNAYTAIVTVGPTPCTSNFIYTTAPAQLSVAFTMQATGSYTNWYWTFGDGDSSNAANPVHTYATSGTYQVCLTIWDSAGTCQDTYCQTVSVNVNSQCDAVFSYQITGQTVYFANQSNGGGVNYSSFWDFGDGNTSNLSNPVHQYAPGTYNVCLVISNFLNCSDTMCQTITILPSGPCQAAFSITPDSTGYGFTFTDQSTGNPTSWYWTFGDGTQSFLQNPTHYYNANGTFQVCLTIADSTCTSTICQSITVGSTTTCLAAFTFTVDTTGYYFSFADNSIGNYQLVSWSFGDGTSSNISNPTHFYPTPGSYNVCLTISNQLGTCQDTYCQTILVPGNNPCVPVFFSYPDSNSVSNGNINFVVNTNPMCGTPTFTWNFGDSTIITTTNPNPNHQYSATGWYYVCVTAIYPNGFTFTFCDSVYALKLSTNIASLPANNFNLTNYPNPVQESTTISFYLANEANIELSLYDISGRLVENLLSYQKLAGMQTIEWNSMELNQGLYFIKLKVNEQTVFNKLNIIR